MSSVGEGASLAAAVITDGLATLAAVVLQKNIFVLSCGHLGSAVEYIIRKRLRIFHGTTIQKVIPDGLATFAAVVLQKNIFVMGSAVEHISVRKSENISCNGEQQRIFHVKPIQKVIIDDLACHTCGSDDDDYQQS